MISLKKNYLLHPQLSCFSFLSVLSYLSPAAHLTLYPNGQLSAIASGEATLDLGREEVCGQAGLWSYQEVVGLV